MRFLIGIGILMLVGCTTQTDEVVSMDQISPSSDKNKNRQDEVNASIQRNERPEKSVFIPLIDGLEKDAIWHKWDTLLFPDRFGPSYSEKWSVKTQSDSLTIVCYQFKDSLRTKNAFYNWMDCFGPKQKAYKIGGELKLYNRNLLIYVAAKQITCIEANEKLDEVKIRALFQEKPSDQNWLYIVNAPRSGKTKWVRIEKGVEKPIVKIDENS